MKANHLFFLLILPLLACMWDNDTIQMENQQFPETLELITGNFLRHSPEYYQWRIRDREAKMRNSTFSLSYYDDLAVAYSKLNQDKKAIQIMLNKERLKSGLYETYANLGTFYLHSGQFPKGIEYIDKAIKINPDAHFGREIYQKYLAEFILQRKEVKIDKIILIGSYDPVNDFYDFLSSKYDNKKLVFDDKEFEKALQGIKGMMKFGTYNSPYLLEALGDLLANNRGRYGRATTLAAMCYYLATKNSPKEYAVPHFLYQ
jgi:tetratricopeptide (TPR) repeat protein